MITSTRGALTGGGQRIWQSVSDPVSAVDLKLTAASEGWVHYLSTPSQTSSSTLCEYNKERMKYFHQNWKYEVYYIVDDFKNEKESNIQKELSSEWK